MRILYLFLLILTLNSCKITQGNIYHLYSISPLEGNKSVYIFRNGWNRVRIIEKEGEFNFIDSIKIIKL